MHNNQKGMIDVYIIGILLAILVAGGLYLKYEFASIKTENEALQRDKKTLKDDNERLIAINQINADTIKMMQNDKQKADEVIKNLKLQNGKDAAAMQSLRAAIDSMAKDPANNGPVSPVLKNTINQIQSRHTAVVKGGK